MDRAEVHQFRIPNSRPSFSAGLPLGIAGLILRIQSGTTRSPVGKQLHVSS